MFFFPRFFLEASFQFGFLGDRKDNQRPNVLFSLKKKKKAVFLFIPEPN